MLRKAQLDETGRVIALFDADRAPVGAIDAPVPVAVGWTYDGGAFSPPPEPPPPPPSVPAKVTRFQARAALFEAGLLDAAEAAVNQIGGITKIAWQDASEFWRDSPALAALAPSLGLSDDALDAMFIRAAQITA